MTVGIGAICEDGRSAVVAADRMLTFGAPMSLQTEPPDLKKIAQLTPECLAVFSGSGPDGEEVLDVARQKLAGATGQPVAHIAEIVKGSYIDLKKKRVEETILKPLLGADYAQFQFLCGQSASSQIFQQTLGLIMQHNLNLEVMIAGLDDGGAHLFVAVHPGQLFPMGTSGFTAIGSGGLHAAVRMSVGQHSKTATLIDTIHNVYEAKRASEVAPGVGKLTDLAIVTAAGIRFADQPLFDKLEEVHKERPELSKEDREKLKGALQ